MAVTKVDIDRFPARILRAHVGRTCGEANDVEEMNHTRLFIYAPPPRFIYDTAPGYVQMARRVSWRARTEAEEAMPKTKAKGNDLRRLHTTMKSLRAFCF